MAAQPPPSPALPRAANDTTGSHAPPTSTVELCLSSSRDNLLQPDGLPIAPPSPPSPPPPPPPHSPDQEGEARDSASDGGGGGGASGGGGPVPKFTRDVDAASIAWPPPRDTVDQHQAVRGGRRINTDPIHRYAPHVGNVRRTFSETVHDSLPRMPRMPGMSSGGARERCVGCGAWGVGHHPPTRLSRHRQTHGHPLPPAPTTTTHTHTHTPVPRLMYRRGAHRARHGSDQISGSLSVKLHSAESNSRSRWLHRLRNDFFHTLVMMKTRCAWA